MIAGIGTTGADMESGGTLINGMRSAISGGPGGVFMGAGNRASFNSVQITGITGSGGVLSAGGNVTNNGSSSGTSNGIYLKYGNTASATNTRLVFGGGAGIGLSAAGNVTNIASGVIFNGMAGSPAANTTVQLTAGPHLDFGANWRLNDGNTIGTIYYSGTIQIVGSVSATALVGPASNGLFVLGNNAVFEVASISFVLAITSFGAGSDLIIDHSGTFGTNVGTGGYIGPLLKNFGGNAVFDIKDLSWAGLTASFFAPLGLPRLTNSPEQNATVVFQLSALGSGAFRGISDGGRWCFADTEPDAMP